MNIVQISIACIVTYKACIYCISRGRLHASASQKKIMFILGNKCIDGRPSQRVNILLSHKVKALWYLYLLARFIGLKVFAFIGLKVLTFIGLKFLAFVGLKVLTFILHRNQSPCLYRTQSPLFS